MISYPEYTPTADVAPVVHAQWIEDGSGIIICPECKQSMSINVKKYTKDQMAKMVEEAQEKTAALEAEIIELKNCIDEKNDLIAEYANLKAAMQRKNVALTERLDQMNGEAINKANEIANLKADADVLRNKLTDTDAALERANAELTYSVAEKNALRNDITKMTDRAAFELGRADYAESHPWRTLWAWLKKKMGCKA